MDKNIFKKLDKISYGVGIVVAIGGLISAVIGDRDQKDLSEKVDMLEKKVNDLSK